ncbi:MAG TPA: metallophosphoesterase [Kofleriaceae bacterium]|nr:metallophosphoesterase [Kofleriaceae bacterium]
MLKYLFGVLLTGSFHLLVWWRLVKPAHLPKRAHRAITIAMIVLWMSIPLTTTARLWAPGFASAASWITMPWMALIGLMTIAMIALELSRLVARAGRRAIGRREDEAQGDLMSRRKFLARVGSGAAVTAASTSVARGMIEARGEHEVVDVEVRLAKLPKALDGFSIVQLSDLHVGLTIDRGFVQRVVDHANRLSPDLIALTGDLVDGPVAELADEIAPLANLRAKHGVYAVTGNHEYYAGADPWIAAIKKLNVTYLRNRLVTIGDGAAAFDLAGVDDHGAYKYSGHGEDLKAATANRDPSRALVLLAHQPRQVRRAAKHGVDLQLSGHTHGGQIWPWHYIVKVQQGGLLAGRYEYEGTQLYVTRGCGYWGPPVRLLAPLEITRVILRSA